MMGIEENTSLSVKMIVIEVKLAQEHRKVWAVFGIMKICLLESSSCIYHVSVGADIVGRIQD